MNWPPGARDSRRWSNHSERGNSRFIEESIGKDNHCIGVLGDGRGKGHIKFFGLARLYYRQSHAQVLGCAGQLLGYYQPVNLIARVDQDRNC